MRCEINCFVDGTNAHVITVDVLVVVVRDYEWTHEMERIGKTWYSMNDLIRSRYERCLISSVVSSVNNYRNGMYFSSV